MKTETIFASSRTSTRRLGLQSAGLESTLVFPMLADSVPPCIEDDRTVLQFQKRQEEPKAETGFLSKLATKAHEKGLSLFEYLTDLTLEDGGGSRFLSLE
jgi:hypothetical protein